MRDVTRSVSLCYVRRDRKSLHVTQHSLVFCRLVVHHSAMLPGSVAMAIGIGDAVSLTIRVNRAADLATVAFQGERNHPTPDPILSPLHTCIG